MTGNYEEARYEYEPDEPRKPSTERRLKALEEMAHPPVPVVHVDQYLALVARVKGLEEAEAERDTVMVNVTGLLVDAAAHIHRLDKELKAAQPALRAAQGLLPIAPPAGQGFAGQSYSDQPITTPIQQTWMPRRG